MNTVTITGNLTADPIARPNADTGLMLATFGLGDNRRTQRDGEWIDATPIFWHVVTFGDLASNALDSLHRGAEVVVTGRIVDDSYERDGERILRLAVHASNVAPSLRNATAKVTKTVREHTSQAG